MDAQRAAVKFPPERMHLVHEELEALHLDFRAGKSVENDAIAVLGLEEPVEKEIHHLAVADQAASILIAPRLRRVEEGADDDRSAGEAPGLGDKTGVRALAGARRSSKKDYLLR